MTSTVTPVLGILNENDNPHENWVVVIYPKGDKPDRLFWRYVTPRPMNGGNMEAEVTEPQAFTPLSHFCVHARMTPDARLQLHHIVTSQPPQARYANGKPRYWQGSTSCTVEIAHRAAAHVLRAIQAEFESRRVNNDQSVA